MRMNLILDLNVFVPYDLLIFSALRMHSCPE